MLTHRPRSLASDLRVAALLVGLVLGPALPVAAAVKAAYVEAVLPSKPFKLTVTARSHLYEDVFVAGDGAFGITSITATNATNFVMMLSVVEPSPAAGHGCGTPVSTTNSALYVTVPARSTVHLTFPSPLVFSAVNGHTCFRISTDENSIMQVLLNGSSN